MLPCPDMTRSLGQQLYLKIMASTVEVLFISHVILIGNDRGVSGFLCTGGADKSLALPTSRCILFDGENISFDASLVIYIYI